MAQENKELSSSATAESSKWLSAVIALTKLTQTGNLRWRRTTPSEAFRTLKPEGEIESVYMAEFKELLLRLYEEIDIKAYEPFFKDSVLKVLGGRRPSSRIVLEMLSHNMENLITFPQVNALPGLLSAVKYQVSDVKNVLEDIVKEADLI